MTLGGIAQLVERCLCKADVSGSSPLTSICFRCRLNEIELMRDTLALRDEEGRSYLRYALGNKKQVLIQRFPNRATYFDFC